MISYHTRAHPKEVEELMLNDAERYALRIGVLSSEINFHCVELCSNLADRLRSVTFDPLTIEGDETLVACKAMFRDSGRSARGRAGQTCHFSML